MADPTTSGEFTGSLKDSIEHVRTVHFSLLVVSLGLLVLGTSWRSNDVVIADEQVSGILEVCRAWDNNWLKIEAEEALLKTSLPYKTFPFSRGESGIQFKATRWNPTIPAIDLFKNWTEEVAFTGTNWTINTDNDELRNTDPKASAVPSALVAKPASLSEFHKFWDLLNEKLLVKIPKNLDPVLQHRTANPQYDISGDYSFTAFQEALPHHTDRFPMMLLAPTFARPFAVYRGVWEWDATTITARISAYDTLPFDGQAHFISLRHDWRWAHGTYQDTFRALNAITKDYESLDVETIKRILDGEKSRSGESFEAFGIKFPADGTTRWGMLLVVGLQLYFLLHLRELAPKLSGTSGTVEVAWIATYRSRLPRLVSAISACLFPLAAVSALGLRALHLGQTSWIYWSMLMIGVGICILLAFLTYRTLRLIGGQ